MNSQLLMFDLDGTLLDSVEDLAAATNRMRERHGLPPLPLETITSYVGDGIRMLAIRALEGATVDPDLAAAEIGAAYAQHLTVFTRPYPGVEEGLRALAAAGHHLVLVTNKPGPHARQLIAHFGWSNLFTLILGGGDTPELKPSPIPLQNAMNRTGHDPSDSWMVGDHHTDLEAARRAGVKSIFLQSGLGHPGNEIPSRIFPDFSSFTAHFLSVPPSE